MSKRIKIFLSFFILLFAIPFTAISQVKNSVPLTDAEFTKAKQLYKEMVTTEAYKKSTAAQNDLFEKLPEVEDTGIFKTDEKFRAFVSKNLSSSKFRTVDEAMVAFKKSLGLKQKLMDQNKEIYAYLRRANSRQYMEIVRP